MNPAQQQQQYYPFYHLSPQYQEIQCNVVQVPTISTFPPQLQEVDWFYQDSEYKWKQFDWRRCNILENMLHYCNSIPFQIVYKDSFFIVDYDHMIMFHESQNFKLRRETSLISRPIQSLTSKWSYYNGQTWIQYEKAIQNQLEEQLFKGESLILVIANHKQYLFDLDQNVQIEAVDSKGYNKRRIITRQWMNNHQLQGYGRTKKQLELTYIKERKALEDHMKANASYKKKMKAKRQPSQLQDIIPKLKKDKNQQFEKETFTHQTFQNSFQLINLDLKQYEEWNKLIDQMKAENDEPQCQQEQQELPLQQSQQQEQSQSQQLELTVEQEGQQQQFQQLQQSE